MNLPLIVSGALKVLAFGVVVAAGLLESSHDYALVVGFAVAMAVVGCSKYLESHPLLLTKRGT